MPEALLAGYQAFDAYIRTEIALCDYIKTNLRVKKTMMLSLDEYGSMLRPRGESHLGLGGRQKALSFYSFDPNDKYIRHDPDDWSTRRYPPSSNEMLRTLGTVSTMLVMLHHADRVKIGCATGGLNGLCRTDREHVWKGSSYYPFTWMINHARGQSLQCIVDCSKYDVPGYAIDDMNQYGGFENVDTIQAAAVRNEERGEVSVIVINADLAEDQLLTLDARSFEGYRFADHTEMFANSPDDADTFEHPDTILPRLNADTSCDGSTVTACLKKASWNVLRFVKEK